MYRKLATSVIVCFILSQVYCADGNTRDSESSSPSKSPPLLPGQTLCFEKVSDLFNTSVTEIQRQSEGFLNLLSQKSLSYASRLKDQVIGPTIEEVTNVSKTLRNVLKTCTGVKYVPNGRTHVVTLGVKTFFDPTCIQNFSEVANAAISAIKTVFNVGGIIVSIVVSLIRDVFQNFLMPGNTVLTIVAVRIYDAIQACSSTIF